MTRIKYSSYHDTDYWIIDCLSSGEKTFKEIRECLSLKKIDYKTNRGYVQRLHSLAEKGIIKKQHLPGNPYPTYALTAEEVAKTSFQAHIFAGNVSTKLLSMPHLSNSSKNKEETMVQEMIMKCGFYVVYNMLHAFELSLYSKSDEDGMEKFEDWIRNTSPMPFLDDHFDLKLLEIVEKKKIADSSYTLKHRKEYLKIFENLLEKLYPQEKQICDKSLKNLDKRSARTFEAEMAIKKFLNTKKGKKFLKI